VSITTNPKGRISQIKLGKGLKDDHRKIEQVPFVLFSLSHALQKLLSLSVKLIMEAAGEISDLSDNLVESTPKSFETRSITDVFQVSSPSTLRIKKKYYDEDDIISSESLDPPPISNLLCIYGINLETEACQFYKRFNKLPC